MEESLLVDLTLWEGFLVHEEDLREPFAVVVVLNLLVLVVSEDLILTEVRLIIVFNLYLHRLTNLGAGHCAPSSDEIALIKCNKLILNDLCHQIITPLSHTHKVYRVPVQNWHHFNHVEGGLEHKSLILLTEINKRLATNLNSR